MHPTLSRLAIAGGMAAVLAVSSAPAATAATAPSTTKYATYAYIAAVEGVGRLHQRIDQAEFGIRHRPEPQRTVYVQRNLKGAWQNMLSRVTNSAGRFTVGFILVPDYSTGCY